MYFLCLYADFIPKGRHARRVARRRARCRLQRKAGKPCKRENYLINSENYKPAIVEPETNNWNSTSYYDYYRLSAELLQLLNLGQNKKKSNGNQIAIPKFDPG